MSTLCAACLYPEIAHSVGPSSHSVRLWQVWNVQVARCPWPFLSSTYQSTAVACLHLSKEDGETQSARTGEAPTGT